MIVESLAHPIVLAPLAGGPATPALAAAVSGAGGLGFLAAGYLSAAALAEQIAAVRAATVASFGVNIFCPAGDPGDPVAVERYIADVVAPLAATAGVGLGRPRHDDDGFTDKLDVVVRARPAVVSFTFGCPPAHDVARLHDAAIEAWVTVTDVAEARLARAAGADVVVAQGAQAGGHRGSFVDHDDPPLTLDALLAALRTELPDVPVVATGGLMDGADIARVLDAGAVAAQLGTAFLCCPEGGTAAVHRNAVRRPGATVLTRAFTGRRARGIANAWTARAGDSAPLAYPEIHHVTSPLRAHGRTNAVADLVNMWAGTEHARARTLPAGELVTVLAAELAATTA